MSVPSNETDNTSSAMIDDDISVIVHDSSDNTIATQTSSSWHSVVSDVHIHHNLFLRPHSVNTWLKLCSFDPDIRLTTAQEWKLRTCMRRFLSLCNLPLKISCTRTKQLNSRSNEHESIPFIDEGNSSSSISGTSLLSHRWSDQDQISNDQLQHLALYIHIVSPTDVTTELLQVKLFECYLKKPSNTTMIHIPLIKPGKFVFHIASNMLTLSLRSVKSLLQLRFLTRENEVIRGDYYKWNDIQNEHIRFDTTVEVDQSLINEFNII